ncbi:hypothetical protein BpHYR1_035023 [Brachionus plicatilis]|uniref:Uncharacterized protein n=1 Tax=Brachionus plicatilis TaxID=10195 RepID=A0A3M7QST0_BRAPC|nr:hypothetical protein BpHYR1_035023 [Brachionus plicatilis]
MEEVNSESLQMIAESQSKALFLVLRHLEDPGRCRVLTTKNLLSTPKKKIIPTKPNSAEVRRTTCATLVRPFKQNYENIISNQNEEVMRRPLQSLNLNRVDITPVVVLNKDGSVRKPLGRKKGSKNKSSN